MALTLQTLKSHLWNCAEILRGSAADRVGWKAYILPSPLSRACAMCGTLDAMPARTWTSYGDTAEAMGSAPAALGHHLTSSGGIINAHLVLRQNGQVPGFAGLTRAAPGVFTTCRKQRVVFDPDLVLHTSTSSHHYRTDDSKNGA